MFDPPCSSNSTLIPPNILLTTFSKSPTVAVGEGIGTHARSGGSPAEATTRILGIGIEVM